MGNKVKPWHAKKPKRFGKKVVGLRGDGGKRIAPLQAENNRVAPLRADSYSEDDYYEDERWKR